MPRPVQTVKRKSTTYTRGTLGNQKLQLNFNFASARLGNVTVRRGNLKRLGEKKRKEQLRILYAWRRATAVEPVCIFIQAT